MTLEAWVLAASLAYAKDAEPRNPAPRAMPATLATAIADASTASPLPGMTDVETSAVLVVFAFRESSYRTDVAGDCAKLPAGSLLCTKALAARSCGAFQTPCERTTMGDAVQQTKLALGIMATSFARCPTSPLSMYATGTCGTLQGSRISELRLTAAMRLLSEVTP